jgi:putative transcriptional regulator
VRKSISDTIINTMRGLAEIGAVDEITMRNVENLCIPEVREYTPDMILAIRKKFNLSQTALASIFNISASTVQKWEQGLKKPAGAARKLLDIIERKGIEAFL